MLLQKIIAFLPEILLVTFGWFLGIGGSLILGRMGRRRQIADVKCGLSAEFRDICTRLSVAVYMLEEKYGCFNKSTVVWVAEHVRKYHGGFIPGRLPKNFQKMAECSDEALRASAQETRLNHANECIIPKNFTTPFLDAKIEYIALMDIDNQNMIFDIRSHLEIINQHIDEATYFFRKTFDSSLSEDDQKIVKKNLECKCRVISDSARSLVEKIDSLVFINDHLPMSKNKYTTD